MLPWDMVGDSAGISSRRWDGSEAYARIQVSAYDAGRCVEHGTSVEEALVRAASVESMRHEPVHMPASAAHGSAERRATRWRRDAARDLIVQTLCERRCDACIKPYP